MIKSKKDFIYFLEADKNSLGVKGSLTDWFTHDIWRFERLLRKVEYYQNCKNNILIKPYFLFLIWRFSSMSKKLGFTIPRNVFGPGLSIGHRGTLIVNGGAKIGKNCRIHPCVFIGTKAGYVDEAPIIGDNVYIGPGAKIFGPIKIADNIAIGANSVVNKSFFESGITIAGIPAKKISDNGSEGLLIKGTEYVKKHNKFYSKSDY